MDQIDEKGRKLVSFYAGGGRVKAKKRVGKRKGGGFGPKRGGPPPMAPMPAAPQDPMAARLDTGVVPRMRAPRRSSIGTALAGALGPVR